MNTQHEMATPENNVVELYASNATSITGSSHADFNAARDIRIGVSASVDGFSIKTEGLRAHGKPELMMDVEQMIFLTAATHIMNDVADFVQQKPAWPTTGQRVQLAPWTTVEFELHGHIDDPEAVLRVKDGGRKESFV